MTNIFWVFLGKPHDFRFQPTKHVPVPWRIPAPWYDTMHTFYDDYRCTASHLQVICQHVYWWDRLFRTLIVCSRALFCLGSGFGQCGTSSWTLKMSGTSTWSFEGKTLLAPCFVPPNQFGKCDAPITNLNSAQTRESRVLQNLSKKTWPHNGRTGAHESAFRANGRTVKICSFPN